MNVTATGVVPTMPKRRTEPDEPARDRLDLRIEPEIRARMEAASILRFGRVNLSAYMRLALMRQLQEDEADMPPPRRRKNNGH